MTLLSYILEFSLSLAVLGLIYWLLLRSETNFSGRRIYLIASVVIAVVLPFFHFQSKSVKEIFPAIGTILSTTWLPELIVGGSQKSVYASTTPFAWTNLLGLAYFSIAIISLIAFLFQMTNLLKLFAQSEKYQWRRCWVTESTQQQPTFSFFRYIFIGQAHLFTANEKQEILDHERVHVQKMHSLDIVLVRLVKIVAWFHPVIYFIHQELVRIHEYEADEQSVKNKDVSNYCGLLAKVALQEVGHPLGNHFGNSLTIKRINMMHTMKQNTKKWKIIVVGMLVAMLAVAIGCQDQVEKTSDDTLTSESLPPEISERVKTLEAYYDNLTVIELNDEGKKTVDRLISEKKYSTVEVTHINATNTGYTILGNLKNLPKNENEVFTQVDQVAQPIFGLNALYKNIGQTIQYPENARRNAVEGKVFIEFVVQTDGTLSDIKVLRGVDEEIDSEALRAFYQLKDKWYPAIHQGQFVKMKMVLPIVFSLEG